MSPGAGGRISPSHFSLRVAGLNPGCVASLPAVVRTGESLQNCPYLAVWSMGPVVQMVSSHVLLDVVVHERSLSRGLPFTCPPPEQYFNPTTYNFGRSIKKVKMKLSGVFLFFSKIKNLYYVDRCYLFAQLWDGALDLLRAPERGECPVMFL